MEGALESGERTALEVLCRLGKMTEEETKKRLSPEGLESKFLEFSFMEKYLLPSVPTFLACSSVLGGAAIFSVVWWRYHSN